MTADERIDKRAAVVDKLEKALKWFQCIRAGYSGDVVVLTRANADRIERTFQNAADLLKEMSPEGGWQPIETAPKDGTNILLSDGANVSEGGWVSQVDQGAEYEGQCGAPGAGWWSVAMIERPTCWQPLPSAPLTENTP